MHTRTVPRRVAIVAESFFPSVNGVSNSVARVAENLAAMGSEMLIIAPGKGLVDRLRTSPRSDMPINPLSHVPNVRVHRVKSVQGGQVDIGTATRRHVRKVIAEFGPDVIHLAAPFALGWAGAQAGRALKIPMIAVFQTDVAAFARKYNLQADRAIWAWVRHVHNQCDATLSPSSETTKQLKDQGIRRVQPWARGVDAALFNPVRRAESVRSQLSPDGKLLVGYVGRLAPEKQVDLLSVFEGDPRIQLVVVGGGPDEKKLQRLLPSALFTGRKSGVELAELYASLDVFVHTGPNETFCQAVQEAQASGVAVVAPRAGGPIDLVEEGCNGFLYPADDRAMLRTAVEALIKNPRLRETVGRQARLDVQDRTWQSLTEQLVEHYGALETRTRSPRPLSSDAADVVAALRL